MTTAEPVLLSVAEMIDLAIGTPEVGVVDFCMLHTVLHCLAQQLGVAGKKVELKGSVTILSLPRGRKKTVEVTEYEITTDGQGTQEKPMKKVDPEARSKAGSIAPTGDTVLVVEKKVTVEGGTARDSTTALKAAPSTEKLSLVTLSKFNILENTVQDLKRTVYGTIPTNEDIINEVRSQSNVNAISDMWTSLNVSSRLEAAEEGINKLSSLIQDLITESPGLENLKERIPEPLVGRPVEESDHVSASQPASDVRHEKKKSKSPGSQHSDRGATDLKPKVDRLRADLDNLTNAFYNAIGGAPVEAVRIEAMGGPGSPGSMRDSGMSGGGGTPGTAGAEGAPGTVVSEGGQETVGAEGAPGTAGAAGAPASVGPAGAPGTVVPGGSPETGGAAGSPEAARAAGVTGAPGTPTEGNIAVTGGVGTAGTAGSDGTPGVQGAQGTLRPTGTTGTPGTTGPGGALEEADGAVQLARRQSELRRKSLMVQLIERISDLEKRLQECCDSIGHNDTNLKAQINSLQDQVEYLTKQIAAMTEAGCVTTLPDFPQDMQGLVQLFQTVQSMQEQFKQVRDTALQLAAEKTDRQNNMDALIEQVEALKTFKLDREDMEEAMADKADMKLLANKVSHDRFEQACDDLSKGLEQTLGKLDIQEALWQQALDDIQREIETKLDKMELSPVKNFFNKKLKQLQENLKKIASLRHETEAAGTKRRLLKDVKCISCDANAVMKMETDANLPLLKGMAPNLSMKPYLSYELDTIRKAQATNVQQRNMHDWEQIEKTPQKHTPRPRSENDKHLCNRYCGGSHTITTPAQRVTRLGHFVKQWGPDVIPLSSGMAAGDDGRMYKVSTAESAKAGTDTTLTGGEKICTPKPKRPDGEKEQKVILEECRCLEGSLQK